MPLGCPVLARRSQHPCHMAAVAQQADMGQQQSSTTDNAAEPNQDMEFEDLLRESLER